MICGLRAYFGTTHQVSTVYVEFIHKSATVPFLEQCHIKAYVRWIEAVIKKER